MTNEDSSGSAAGPAGFDPPTYSREQVVLEWTWRLVGFASLKGEKIVFPKPPSASGGIYRFRIRDGKSYVGQPKSLAQ